MSFRITCCKCGNEQIFDNMDSANGENITFYTFMGLEIHCNNEECGSLIDLNDD